MVWLHKIKDTSAKLGRWALQLYSFDIVYREGKNLQNADAISRIPYPPTPETPHEEEEFPSPLVQNIEREKPQGLNQITEITFEYNKPKQFVVNIENKQVRLDDMSNIAKLQRECPEISDMIRFIETGELPDDN